jgi:hypothetical protein
VKDLTKKKLGQFSKVLEAAQAAFRAEVEKLAEQTRTEILPYFKKHGLDFMAGNGSWVITIVDKENGREADDYEMLVDDDKLPKNIRDALMLEVAYADHLGFYVRDIKRGEW